MTSTTPQVAYQGRPGAWSELAAQQLFDNQLSTLPCQDFGAVIESVIAGKTQYGLLPVYNLIAREVVESCELLAKAPVEILQEIRLPISHALLTTPGTTLEAVRHVYSHPVALAQCQKYFSRNPSITAVDFADTAGAVEWLMMQSRHDIAAIAPQHAALLYGADVIARGLEDQSNNATRFVLFTNSH